MQEERGKRNVKAARTHVGLAVARHDRRSEHLRELLDVGLEAGDGVDDADEGEHDCRGVSKQEKCKPCGHEKPKGRCR